MLHGARGGGVLAIQRKGMSHNREGKKKEGGGSMNLS